MLSKHRNRRTIKKIAKHKRSHKKNKRVIRTKKYKRKLFNIRRLGGGGGEVTQSELDEAERKLASDLKQNVCFIGGLERGKELIKEEEEATSTGLSKPIIVNHYEYMNWFKEYIHKYAKSIWPDTSSLDLDQLEIQEKFINMVTPKYSTKAECMKKFNEGLDVGIKQERYNNMSTTKNRKLITEWLERNNDPHTILSGVRNREKSLRRPEE